jgi:glutamate carboxypeptidase
MSDNLLAAAEAVWGGAVRAGLDQLEAQGEAIIARTERWSLINSGSRELSGLGRMRQALTDAFSELPGALACERLAPTEAVRADGAIESRTHGEALRLRVRPDAPIRIALTGHYDTVFPAAHAFQKPWREGENLRGPGVADMKGGLSVMLAALAAFEALPGEKRVGYEVLLSPDEEIGSPASAPLLAELGARTQLGLTYEPAMASGALVSARKGSGNFSLAFAGRAAHVGRAFAEGRNAVIAAAETALALNALNGAREGVSFNVGAVDGGGPVNIVPDKAVLRFNVRAPDAGAVAWAQAEIERIAAAPREGVSARLHGGFARPPKPLTRTQEIIVGWTRDAGAALGLDLAFQPSGGVCEGNNLAAAGCPNIDTLGPCGGGLHSDEEFARLDSFAERAKLSFLMLAGLACGAFDPADLKA